MLSFSLFLYCRLYRLISEEEKEDSFWETIEDVANKLFLIPCLPEGMLSLVREGEGKGGREGGREGEREGGREGGREEEGEERYDYKYYYVLGIDIAWFLLTYYYNATKRRLEYLKYRQSFH